MMGFISRMDLPMSYYGKDDPSIPRGMMFYLNFHKHRWGINFQSGLTNWKVHRASAAPNIIVTYLGTNGRW